MVHLYLVYDPISSKWGFTSAQKTNNTKFKWKSCGYPYSNYEMDTDNVECPICHSKEYTEL